MPLWLSLLHSHFSRPLRIGGEACASHPKNSSSVLKESAISISEAITLQKSNANFPRQYGIICWEPKRVQLYPRRSENSPCLKNQFVSRSAIKWLLCKNRFCIQARYYLLEKKPRQVLADVLGLFHIQNKDFVLLTFGGYGKNDRKAEF